MIYVVLMAAILLCIFLSGFFSGSEMAYSSCNRLRLEGEKEDGSKAAAVALYIVDHFDDALGAILIGNNLVNVAASSLLSVAVILFFGGDNPKIDTWNTVLTVLLTVTIIIFGETIPKITAKKSANRLSVQYAWPIRILMTALKPLVFVVVGLVTLLTGRLRGEKSEDSEEKVEELQSIIETAEDEAVGKCTEIAGLQGFPTISGLHTIPLRPKEKFAPGYLGYYMNSCSYHDQLLPLMQGITLIDSLKG